MILIGVGLFPKKIPLGDSAYFFPIGIDRSEALRADQIYLCGI
jgi:hypothetical protein